MVGRGEVPDEVERADVEAARAGDRCAYERLVERYGKRVLSIAWEIVRDAAEAEDLAQDAFLRGWRRIGRFDSSRSFGPWIFTIVTRMAIDRVRKRNRWRFLPIASQVREDHRGADRRAIDHEISRRIDDAIESLPEMQRIVSRLHFVQELSAAEIASMTGLTDGTVRSHLSHARSKLKQILRDLK